jgi:hypothetical protein
MWNGSPCLARLREKRFQIVQLFSTSTASNEIQMPEEASKDMTTIDALIAELYQSISGPASKQRDWDRLRSLFFPGARLLRTVASSDVPMAQLSAMTVEEFIAAVQPHFQTTAFYELELARREDRFSHIAQVFSTYGAFSDPDGREPLGRGINSIQLWFDGRRWWIASLLWDDERWGTAVPAQYLPTTAPGIDAPQDDRAP